jgi:16S rRNA (adenine(1408)-N(1))-methyltransferase
MIDVGTGDGRAVVATARRESTTLVLGLDANAAGMADASRRAARAAHRGGIENARFVLGAAESPPAELSGRADLVTVRFPWGSLLRGCVGRDGRVAAGIAALVADDGTLELLLAATERDRLEGVPTDPGDLSLAAAAAFAGHAFVVTEARTATPEELLETGSTWARRLRRPATLVRLARR